jgi:hypothetical protein
MLHPLVGLRYIPCMHAPTEEQGTVLLEGLVMMVAAVDATSACNFMNGIAQHEGRFPDVKMTARHSDARCKR